METLKAWSAQAAISAALAKAESLADAREKTPAEKAAAEKEIREAVERERMAMV
jgi:hypothetical protein